MTILINKKTIFLLIIILLFSALAITSLSKKSLTCDEAAHHICTGYIYLRTGDIAFATDSPPLARYLGAIPLLFMNIDLPADRTFWARDDRAEFSREFLYTLNKDKVGQITFFSRIPMVLLAVFGGLFLFFWVRRHFGENTALLAAIIYFLSPNIIAHARLATTDMPATVFIMCAVLTFYDLTQERSTRCLLPAALFLGLALLSKYSALLLIPLFFIYFMLARGQNRSAFARNIWLMVIFSFVTFLVLWAGYLFEFKPFLVGVLRQQEKLDLFRNMADKLLPFNALQVDSLTETVLMRVPVPLGSFVLGVIGVLRHGSEGAATFFMGKWNQAGSPYYYLLAFFIKTPIPIIISFFIGVVAVIIKPGIRKIGIYFGLIIAVFFVMASRSNLQLGVRYILPLYPLMFIGAAAGIDHLAQKGIWGRAVCAGILSWLLLASVLAWPNYLSYFNVSIGGSANGYKYLRDSNLDWGQDLPALKKYMVDNNVDEIGLAYFGTAEPAYFGIKYTEIPEEELVAPKARVYAVSAQYLDMVQWPYRDTPTATAGYSIFIYDHSDEGVLKRR